MDFLSDGSRGYPGFPLDRSREIGSGGIRRIVDRHGKGEGPRYGDQASIAFTGWLPDGRRIAGCTPTQPLVFPIGDERMVQGLSDAVVAMQPGEKARFLIPPDLAYGAAGKPPAIPGDSDLIFAVELLSFWAPIGPGTTLMRNELVAYGEWKGFVMCMKEHKAYVFDQSVAGLVERIRRSPISVRQLLEAERVAADSRDDILRWLGSLVELQLFLVRPGGTDAPNHRAGLDATSARLPVDQGPLPGSKATK